MATTLQPVSRGDVVLRCVRHRCPNCGGGGLFETAWRMRERCPHCGLPLETGDGFFLGSMTISYGLIVFGFLAPVAALWVLDVMAESWAIGLSLGGTVVLSLVLYRPSKFWWLAAYYGFLVQELPTNRLARGVLEAGDDRM